MRYKVHHPAENYILLDFGNTIDEKNNKYILALAQCIKHSAVIEIIPAYSSILIEYDRKETQPENLLGYIKKIKPDINMSSGTEHIIPVVYGGNSGPDINFVASQNGLTVKQVIDYHSNRVYRVYMLGFLPGFLYLGGLNPIIACRRKQVPGLRIPKGSVGIAGMQTGVYPEESPGGWQIIGRTSFELYRSGNKNPFPVKAGDTVRFTPVGQGAKT